jgi:hypothetical protein
MNSFVIVLRLDAFLPFKERLQWIELVAYLI